MSISTMKPIHKARTKTPALKSNQQAFAQDSQGQTTPKHLAKSKTNKKI